MIEDRASADPTNLETQAALAETLYYEATCAFQSGDTQGAAEQFRRCRDIRRKLVVEPDAKLPKVNLMLALARCGEHAEAAKIAGELVETPPRVAPLLPGRLRLCPGRGGHRRCLGGQTLHDGRRHVPSEREARRLVRCRHAGDRPGLRTDPEGTRVPSVARGV